MAGLPPAFAGPDLGAALPAAGAAAARAGFFAAVLPADVFLAAEPAFVLAGAAADVSAFVISGFAAFATVFFTAGLPPAFAGPALGAALPAAGAAAARAGFFAAALPADVFLAAEPAFALAGAAAGVSAFVISGFEAFATDFFTAGFAVSAFSGVFTLPDVFRATPDPPVGLSLVALANASSPGFFPGT